MFAEILQSTEKTTNPKVDFLGNQVRLAYFTYVEKYGELPKDLKDNLTEFYLKLDLANIGQYTLEGLKKDAELILVSLNKPNVQDTAYTV